VALLLGVSACGDDDGAADPAALDAGSDPAGSSSTTTTSDGSDEGDDVDTTGTTTTTSTTSTVLVAPEPAATDTTPATTLPATVGIPAEGERTNEGGVPITLDETAALACANAEFARDSITFDNLDQAERDLSAAADRAEVSEQPAIADEADTIRAALDTADPLAVVEAFLDICVEHGHQI
jgi:hypothetical protein